MSSAKQRSANRRNARRSTGPRTPYGKRASSRNRVRHGLRARQITIPGEEAREFADLLERLRDEHDPVGELEHMLVDQIAANMWRLRRALQIEAELLSHECFTVQSQRWDEVAGTLLDEEDLDEDGEPRVVDEAAYDRAVARSTEAWEERNGPRTLLGQAFARLGPRDDSLQTVWRYQVMLERSIQRSLRELERVQEARRGGAPGP